MSDPDLKKMTPEAIRQMVDELKAENESLRRTLEAQEVVHDENNTPQKIVFSASGMLQRKKGEDRLARIEWMLDPDHGTSAATGENVTPEYGDLSALNTRRIILDSVGRVVLKNIVEDFLHLLGTSAAVYESNGDYALGLFSSRWCRFMDTASWRLCNTKDEREALACGKWLCHESCLGASKICMESGAPVDIPCAGGIRLYAAPIYSNGKIVGTMNMGYGDPPRDKVSLEKLSGEYGVTIAELLENAASYEHRPHFIIEIAKQRLLAATQLIGEIVDRKQTEDALEHSYDLMRYIIEHANSAVAVHDRDLKYIYVSQRYLDRYKVKETDVIGKHHYDVFPDLPRKWRDVHQKALAGEVSRAERDSYPREDGTLDWTRWECRPWYEADGSIGGIIVYTEIITERVAAEEALRESEAKMRDAQALARMGRWELDLITNRLDWSDGIYELFEVSRDKFGASYEAFLSFVHPDDRGLLDKTYRSSLEKKTPYEIEHRLLMPDGRIKWVNEIGRTEYDETGQPIRSVGTVQNITESKQAELEREKLQEQLNQAQKMESVGRLAGGVAHDFNNMLTIINGYAEMMADILPPSDPLYDSVKEIYDAGKRSEIIVRKLMAFARKQAISPVSMNLNDSVSSMLKMLQGLIGENIDLLWKPENNIWLVKMDYSQVDQILANLAVNARDAIAGIGKTTIETQNVEFDDEYCETHAGFVPGQFVMLAVSDSGCGMDKHVLANLFEPFFTTKEVGQGTGLGLPTVYGIVKQNHGFINVYSEPEKGTTVRIYLPRLLEAPESADREKAPEVLSKGRGETILVLEDEATVLDITRMMLEKLGYIVLAANTPNNAIALAEAHDGKIDLLITDVVMPEMNGREFSDKLNVLYPDIKSLFMSGYTADVIARHGILEEGLHFIEKPFSIDALAAKVRGVLDS